LTGKGVAMSRAINREGNSFLQVLLKLIPSEIIAVFVFVQGVLPNQLPPHLVFTAILLGLTPVYLRWGMGVRSRAQLVISTLSLAVWILAMGNGPVRFLKPPLYEPWYGSMALALWTLVPPIFMSGVRPDASRSGRSTSRHPPKAPPPPRR
jgi:hypothetical protein